MNQKERMLANLPYRPEDKELTDLRLEARKKVYEYNHLPPEKWENQVSLLKEIVGKCGEQIYIEPPFHCDYGINIEVGENFFANFNFVVLDVAKVKLGKNVLCGPNVSIYTASHPIHPVARNSGYEYGIDVTIGDNVWIGGGSTILPGVTIGDNVVIGSCSVVTKDVPSNCIVIGNPCRIVRTITEEDKLYYFKDRRFEESILEEINQRC